MFDLPIRPLRERPNKPVELFGARPAARDHVPETMSEPPSVRALCGTDSTVMIGNDICGSSALRREDGHCASNGCGMVTNWRQHETEGREVPNLPAATAEQSASGQGLVTLCGPSPRESTNGTVLGVPWTQLGRGREQGISRVRDVDVMVSDNTRRQLQPSESAAFGPSVAYGRIPAPFCELCESTNVMAGEGCWDCMSCGLSKNWSVEEASLDQEDVRAIDHNQASEQLQGGLQRGMATEKVHVRRYREVEEEKRQSSYQARSEQENKCHIRRLREAEEAEQPLNQARFDAENEAQMRRLRGGGVEHEPIENQSAEVGTWSIYAGRTVELADREAPGASHMVTTTAVVMFRVERDAEAVNGGGDDAVFDFSGEAMEL